MGLQSPGPRRADGEARGDQPKNDDHERFTASSGPTEFTIPGGVLKTIGIYEFGTTEELVEVVNGIIKWVAAKETAVSSDDPDAPPHNR